MIQGLTVILLASAGYLAIRGLIALLRNKSEGARRLKLVLAVLLAIPVATVWFMMVGPMGFGITLALVGAAFWVARGYQG